MLSKPRQYGDKSLVLTRFTLEAIMKTGFNSTLKTVFIIHGFATTMYKAWVPVMKETFLQKVRYRLEQVLRDAFKSRYSPAKVQIQGILQVRNSFKIFSG